MSQTLNQRRILHDHIKPHARVPRVKQSLYDMETLCELAKGAAAVVLAGIAGGLIAIAVRLMWELSNGYLEYFLRGLV